MRITTLQIYGFGQHSDETIELNEQLTLLYGLNEAGKTTIYEFILQILFGFPQKNHVIKSYEPKKGGAFGGKLLIDDEQYGQCIVERTAGKAGGIVKVQLGTGEIGDEKLLVQLLRGHTRSDIEAVFAFSMHQLQHLDKMTPDELNRTLLASGTTGIEEITKLEKALIKESQGLFKKSGQNPLINRQAKEVQLAENDLKEERQRIEQYEPKHAQMLELERSLVFLENEQAQLSTTIQQAHLYLQNEPLLQRKEEIEFSLQQLTQINFPTKGMQRFEQSDAKLQQIQQEIAMLERQTIDLKKELQAVVDEKQLEQLNDWLRNDEQWRQWRTQRDQLLQQQQKIEAQIEMKKQLLGVDRAILKLDSSLANEAIFLQQLTELEELKIQLSYYKQAITDSENELQQLQQNNSQNSKQKATKQQSIKKALIISSSIIIATLVLALIFQQWLVLLGGTVIAYMIYFIVKNKKTSTVVASSNEQLKRNRTNLKNNYEKVVQQQQQIVYQLQNYLNNLGVTNVVDSEMYGVLFQNLRGLQERTIEQHQVDNQLDLLQQQIDEHYRVGCQILKIKAPESELSAIALKKIQQQELELKSMDYTKQQLHELEQRLLNSQQQQRYLQQQQQQLFVAAAVKDEEAFYEVAQLAETKQQLQNELQQLKQQLFAIPTLQIYTISQLDELQARYELQKQQYAAALKEHATLSVEVQHLVKDKQYSMQLQQQEQRKSELQNNIKKWVRIKIIEQAIKDTLEEMKEQKLPNVLHEAAMYFSYLTAERYKKIMFVEDIFVAVNKDDDQITISELSQATKEQAYLALRLSLAKEKYKTAPFPLLLDDPFVHFDTLRTAKVVQLLSTLQRDHQILFFSCQERMIADFDEQNILEVRALQMKGD